MGDQPEEDKDLFCSRLDFEQFRDDSYRKENSRRQNLVLITAATTWQGIVRRRRMMMTIAMPLNLLLRKEQKNPPRYPPFNQPRRSLDAVGQYLVESKN